MRTQTTMVAFPVTSLAISKNVLWLLFTTPENLKYNYCTKTYTDILHVIRMEVGIIERLGEKEKPGGTKRDNGMLKGEFTQETASKTGRDSFAPPTVFTYAIVSACDVLFTSEGNILPSLR